MEPTQRPPSVETLIEAQGLHIAVLQAQIAGCHALHSIIKIRSPHSSPRPGAPRVIGRTGTADTP